jgi:hypothetical protein
MAVPAISAALNAIVNLKYAKYNGRTHVPARSAGTGWIPCPTALTTSVPSMIARVISEAYTPGEIAFTNCSLSIPS